MDPDGAMLDESVLWRFSGFVDLTAAERRALLSLLGPAAQALPGETIHLQGDPPRLYLLHEGTVLSVVGTADGSRRVLKVHRPGDVMGAPSLPYAGAAESLVALTPSRVGPIALPALGELFARWPRLGAVMFLAAQAERVALMDRLVMSGCLDAAHSFAALLLQLLRSSPPGAPEAALHLPLTQPQIADVLGLSAVHVNRVVKALERDGLILREGYLYHILDLARLEAYAGMPRRVPARNPSWLPPASG